MREDGKPREDGKLREDGKPRKCWGDVSRERSNGVTCLTWLQFPTSRLKKNKHLRSSQALLGARRHSDG